MRWSLAVDDEKVLRFCLARVRAWSTEYCLYSMDPQAGLSPANAVEESTESKRFIEAAPETRIRKRPEVGGHARQPATDPTNALPGVGEPSEKKTGEQKMTESKVESAPAGVWPSFDTIEFGGPVDTRSVLESSDVPPVTSSGAMCCEPLTSTHPHITHAAQPSREAKAVEVEVNEVAAKPRRAPAFQPLPSLVVESPTLRPKTKVARLRLPRVVSQILGDLPTQWQALAKEIETRVARDGLGSLMVASSTFGEGATTVACALATALAQHTSLRILLVDADFRRPALAAMLHLPSRVGIEHHLLERVSLDEIIVSCDTPKLDILPTLEAFEMPDPATAGKRLAGVMARLRSAYDLVILDVGAVLATGTPVTLPEGTDASLVVRDPSKSGQDLLDRLDAHFADHGVCSLGVIENGVDA